MDELLDFGASPGTLGENVQIFGDDPVLPTRYRIGTAVAQMPAVEIVKIGDAPPRPMPEGDRPLSGTRVLDRTRVIAGPTASRTLAEHGADVLKITRLGLADSGQMDLDTGIGKLSTRLDPREQDEHTRLRDLCRTCDVFAQSYRPGTLAGRGFGPEELAELKRGMVYVTLSAWGNQAPWKNRRGYDTEVQAATGMADASRDDTGPKQLPVFAIDYVGCTCWPTAPWWRWPVAPPSVAVG